MFHHNVFYFRAIRNGTEMIELDVQLTADGVVSLFSQYKLLTTL